MSLETFEVRRRYEGDQIVPAHKVFQFPGGESHIDFKPSANLQVAYMRSGSGDDLASLAMWADACHRHGLYTVALIPYLPGARMDRGVPLGAKVYADIINSLNIHKIVAVDPHSDVAPALHNNLTVLDAADIVPTSFEIDGVIAPDLGAVKRSEKVAAKFGVPVIQAGKHRDFATGKLSGFWCDTLPKPSGRYLLVDDICDGGGTFNGLSKTIKDVEPNVSLYLWVTHGIFSQGLDTLRWNFTHIFTTDSHDGARAQETGPALTRIPIIETMLKATGRYYK